MPGATPSPGRPSCLPLRPGFSACDSLLHILPQRCGGAEGIGGDTSTRWNTSPSCPRFDPLRLPAHALRRTTVPVVVDQKVPGGAFEPLGLPDPPGCFVVWPRPPGGRQRRRSDDHGLHCGTPAAIRRSGGSHPGRPLWTGLQCWQHETPCCCSGCQACSCCDSQTDRCSACCSRSRPAEHATLAAGPRKIVRPSTPCRNRQVSAWHA